MGASCWHDGVSPCIMADDETCYLDSVEDERPWATGVVETCWFCGTPAHKEWCRVYV